MLLRRFQEFLISDIKDFQIERISVGDSALDYFPLSEIEQRKRGGFIYEKKDFYKIYIDYPRDELIKQISFRTSQMIDEGAILEAKKFLKLKVPKNKTASKAIGLNEISQFLNKKIQISELIE